MPWPSPLTLVRGAHTGKKTEDGLPIYSLDELNIGHGGGASTSLPLPAFGTPSLTLLVLYRHARVPFRLPVLCVELSHDDPSGRTCH